MSEDFTGMWQDPSDNQVLFQLVHRWNVMTFVGRWERDTVPMVNGRSLWNIKLAPKEFLEWTE